MLSYCTPVTLTGHTVTLEPLTLDHAPALLQALNNDEEIWRYIPVEQPQTLDDMRGWIATALAEQAQGQRLPFAVIHNAGGRAIGSTSYPNISEPNRTLDIGWTWYARQYWRTAVNTECKYLLLRHAFETLGCIRVGLRTDLRNIRSQHAIERIGGVKEGVLRKAQILYDGHQRFVVLYSILDEEWPTRKAWFEARLAVAV
jgi:N-acetyltransferase